MCEVILVRPGHTDFDEQRRIQGRLDLPLNARGEQHVDEVVRRLGPIDLDVILTGPGEPTRSTAEALGRALGVSVKVKDELQNLDQGLWQGLQLDEIRRKYPKLIKQWHEHPESICPPQGEPVCEAMSRLRDALKKPLKKYDRFMIVAADPLATLIAGLVCGGKSDFTGPMCSHAGPCVQRLTPGEPCADDKPANSKSAAGGWVNGGSLNGAGRHTPPGEPVNRVAPEEMTFNGHGLPLPLGGLQ